MGVKSGSFRFHPEGQFQTHFKTSDRSHFLSRLDPLTNLLNIKQLQFIGAFGQLDELEGVKNSGSTNGFVKDLQSVSSLEMPSQCSVQTT